MCACGSLSLPFSLSLTRCSSSKSFAQFFSCVQRKSSPSPIYGSNSFRFGCLCIFISLVMDFILKTSLCSLSISFGFSFELINLNFKFVMRQRRCVLQYEMGSTKIQKSDEQQTYVSLRQLNSSKVWQYFDHSIKLILYRWPASWK